MRCWRAGCVQDNRRSVRSSLVPQHSTRDVEKRVRVRAKEKRSLCRCVLSSKLGYKEKAFFFHPSPLRHLYKPSNFPPASSNILDIHRLLPDLPLQDLLFAVHLDVAQVRLRFADQTFLSATLELFRCELLRQRATGRTVTDRREEARVCVRKRARSQVSKQERGRIDKRGRPTLAQILESFRRSKPFRGLRIRCLDAAEDLELVNGQLRPERCGTRKLIMRAHHVVSHD
jgi:hypothetical protein